ncbi:MAG: polysaccharide biosynthesis/export family protein [Paludibacteraceae bacterium]|nr:polysaccharide biosynthesis/export family protein [Paludibacteraceae bacterium]
MKHIKLYILFAVALMMSSCYNYKTIGLLQEKNASLPVYNKTDYADYRIQINDEIIYRLMTSDETISKLISSGTSSMSSQNMISYRVYPDGTVDLPFLKSIPVAGLTLSDASRVVEDRFKEIIPDAAVKLSIANKTFTVIGEAGTGIYQITREKMTIYQALSLSGNLNNAADFKNVRILRETDNGTKVLRFDIRPVSLIESEYYYVYPNDIIYVQRAKSSFYKVNNWSSFMGLISTSLSLLFTVLYYGKL